MPLFDKLTITSPDFTPLGALPAEFSADGGNRFPRLSVSGVPAAAVELAVICHDPDAPLPNGFTHLTAYGIPADASGIDLSAVRIGPNGMGQAAWFGPQPPAGHGVHHYYFWVYALSSPVDGTPTREEFLAQYGPSVLEQARVVGTFEN